MKHMTALFVLVAPLVVGAQDAGKDVTLGDLQLKVADGWTVTKAGEDWTQLVPPGVANVAEACAAIRSGLPLEGSWWASHKKIWAGLRDGFGMKDADPVLQIPDAPGLFIASSGRWVREGQGGFDVRLYTAIAGKALVGILYTGGNHGTWSLQTWPLERMLRAATVKGGAARPAPKVSEAWQCVTLHTTHHAGGQTASKVRNDRLVLFENGAADTSLMHVEGYDAFPTWKIDADLMDGAFGAWKSTDKELDITLAGRTDRYTRDGDTLRRGDQVWKPMPRVDGLRLAGRYSRRSDPGAVFAFYTWIEFTADGRFTMEGMLDARIVEGNPQQVPAGGKGSYEIRNWTLTLKLDGGFTQSQDLLIMEGDVKKPDSLWLLTCQYAREK